MQIIRVYCWWHSLIFTSSSSSYAASTRIHTCVARNIRYSVHVRMITTLGIQPLWDGALLSMGEWLPTFRKKASHILGVRFMQNTRSSELWRRSSHLPSKGGQELDYRRQRPFPQDQKTPPQLCQPPNESCLTQSYRIACVHEIWYLEPTASQK
jgi:hypothetical protein